MSALFIILLVLAVVFLVLAAVHKNFVFVCISVGAILAIVAFKYFPFH